MIIYKKFLDCKIKEYMSCKPNENLLTIRQRKKLAESEQAKQEIENAKKRLLEVSELEETEALKKEKQMLQFKVKQAQKECLTEDEKKALIAEVAELDETVYVVDDNSKLAKKIMESAPYFEFVLDDVGELVDITPLPKPVVIPEPTTEDYLLDLDYRLSLRELGV